MTTNNLVVGIDGRAIYRDLRRGTGKNLIDLYRALAELQPDWRFVAFHQIDDGADPFPGASCVTHRRIDMPGDRFNFWQNVRFPLAARLAGVDVVHCPANTAPRWPLAPMVLTIHDLIPLDPEFSDPRLQSEWRAKVAASARKARRIITPSHFVKEQIIREFAVHEAKITVNHWAPDSKCRRVCNPLELERIRCQYGLPDHSPYVLAFGSGDPRKNTARLIDAWALLPKPLRSQGRLLLVGVQGKALDTFRRHVQNANIADSCLLHGFAPEEDLPGLISGAAVLCYPSLSEGFGLPILDGFVCQTPVLAGNVTSIPEVAADAALLVDVRDSRALAEGLRQLLENSALRDQLVQRGSERLKQFTWTDCARRVSRAFQDVLQGAS